MNALLLSNSASSAGYLIHAQPWLSELTSTLTGSGPALFVPFAGVTRTWDDYTQQVADALLPAGIAIRGLHQEADPACALAEARLIIVGGGNTFQLLRELRRRGLLSLIAERVRAGQAGYVGWSAGANIAAPTICTTNDMPIVDPGGFEALDLVPFQINPHYTTAHPPGHLGETRDQRIAEFCAIHPQRKVVALPEGSALRLDARGLALLGTHPALLFHGAVAAQALAPGKLSLL
ncbi:dipeptidase PepE [Bordetella holmesii]|uniref:Asp-specific dipeptidase n=3 Tax=Bordetella holmesii TaxID=35814 RepID=A0A158M1C0_9BORD|nr:dipeptidase PepE [Bordetella holmesii]AHV91419.1 peptidase E [Bordetella holmesii ATCC 51541]AIT27879.1 peptidase E [Bordetella holmesii 44057]EWM40657.1 peptidase E [Bordetella holmesii 35009]EWM41539.1 peptidase E [Bordetella holmesii 41130]EWM44554.1 peptidase E [Bordetella holmesii 70147]